ncbi:MAG: AAA family ATPase [Planctomycetaceae bacterium]|nr:AAA family ATPase [Planctomycetaceae bacterium]
MSENPITAQQTPDEEPGLAIGRRLVDEVLTPLKRTYVGKDEVIDLLGVCLAGGENLFILGPPGTAKSAIVQDLSRRLEGVAFDYLLTRFTEPNELFGPFDIRRLREGELVTNTQGMLPEASLVFLDELLNANSAILNSLLMVLNEKVFRRGKETIPLPLLMVVGASNRLPEDDALRALFDRFLMRVHCDNVSDDRLGDVLDAGWKIDGGLIERGTTLMMDDIRRLQGRLHQVDIQCVRLPYLELIRRLRHAGIDISDRRAIKFQRLVAASSLLCGRLQAAVSDFWILQYIWDRQEQQEVLQAIVQEALSKDVEMQKRHPRAQAQSAPDPEAMARDLEWLGKAIGEAKDATARSPLRDRLAVLAGRCQWVSDANQRGFLQQQVDQLWKHFEGRSDA